VRCASKTTGQTLRAVDGGIRRSARDRQCREFGTRNVVVDPLSFLGEERSRECNAFLTEIKEYQRHYDRIS